MLQNVISDFFNLHFEAFEKKSRFGVFCIKNLKRLFL